MLCKDFADFHVDIALVNVDEVVQNQARKLRNLASVTDVDKKILQEKAAIEDELKELDRKKKQQQIKQQQHQIVEQTLHHRQEKTKTKSTPLFQKILPLEPN